MRRLCARVLISCVVTALLPLPLAAQPGRGTVTGVATAADGARLPGVVLRLIGENSDSAVESLTNEAGVFWIPNVAAGRYRLEATLDGFEPLTIRNIAVLGSSVSLRLPLAIAVVRESVRVVGEARRDTVQAFEMREGTARDLGEALAVLPGLTRVRKGAIANDVVLRGFQGKDINVLIDGQRLDGACPGHMDPPAFHVDFSEVTRVEVSKGPFDVKNQGGLAGAVNVVTDRPQRGWHGSANMTVASAATLSIGTSGSFGSERWGALAGASMRRAAPYRNGRGESLVAGAGYRPERVADVRAYDVWTAWGRVAVPLRDATLVQVSYTRQSADAIVYPYLQMDAAFDSADRLGARVETANLPGAWDTFAAHVYYTRVDHWMTDALRTTSDATLREYSMGTRADTAIGGARAELQRGPLTFGVEASRRNWNTQTMLAMQNYAPQAALPDVTITVAGAFVTYTTDPTPAWRVEAGGRVDAAVTTANPSLANTDMYRAYHATSQTRATDSLPTGYVRARWRAEHGWSAVAGLGHSTRLPDQQERFSALQRRGSDWVGNPRLAPSRNTGLEGELRYTGRGFDGGLAAFVYRIDDAIRPFEQRRVMTVPGVVNGIARSYANVDALSRGLEANATVALMPSLSVNADVSLVRGTARDETRVSLDLPEIPPARLRVRLRYDRVRWSAALEGVGSARQDRVAADLREASTAAFGVVNARGAWRTRKITVSVAVENLFDTLYSEHLSYQRDPFRSGTRVFEPGRTLSVNTSARF